MQGFVCTQPVRVGKATRADNPRGEKRRQGMSGEEGVRAVELERHEIMDRIGETHFADEFNQADEFTKRGDGL